MVCSAVPGASPPNGVSLCRNERADAAHGRVEGFDEFQIFCEGFGRLERRADHEAAADLKTDVLEVTQAAHSVVERHFRRVQLFVVRLVRGFVPQQIAVGARLEHGLIRLARELAERQRDRAVGELRLDAAHRAADLLHAERAVLAALHDERAEAETVALAGALENLVLVSR